MTVGPTDNHRAQIDGAAFEQLALALLREAGASLPDFRIEHQELVSGVDGEYRIDITARFRQLGIDFLILAECKDHSRAVEREDVQVLADKKRATGAHKAILFATNGFQRGAIEYAKVNGVALIRVLEGELIYDVRGANLSGRSSPPPWAHIDSFVAQEIHIEGPAVHVSLVERGRPNALVEYLVGRDPHQLG